MNEGSERNQELVIIVSMHLIFVISLKHKIKRSEVGILRNFFIYI